ncbi:hypothetical protein BKA93DRAFT_819902 [Sparassis latifolia]
MFSATALCFSTRVSSAHRLCRLLPHSISVTFQIANDLCTELFDDERDIDYACWKSSAYKEIAVPLPPSIREGHPHVVNLAGATLGEPPFPVLSMPILLSSQQVERVYRTLAGTGDQLFLDVKERTFVSLAQARPSDSTALVDNLLEILMSCEPRNIVELASAMPLLAHNIAANEALFRSASTHPHALVLRWDDEQLPNGVSAIVSDLDLTLMADVTYNTSFPSLIRTLSALTVATQSKSPLILLEYNERDAAERTLWNMMCEVGIKFEQVGEKVGSGGEPAEIWVGSVLP